MSITIIQTALDRNQKLALADDALIVPLEAKYLVQMAHLTTPATVAKYVEAACTKSVANLVMLDLEDSIPRGNDDLLRQGRENIVNALNRLDWGRRLRFFRPRGMRLDPGHTDIVDVVASAGARLDGIVYPKIESAAEVVSIDHTLSALEAHHGLAPGKIKIEVLIESAAAEEQAFEIARSSRRLAGLIFGAFDYWGSLRMIGEKYRTDHPLVDHARARIVKAAASVGIPAIAEMTLNYPTKEKSEAEQKAALDECRRDAEYAKSFGFRGKWTGIPAQTQIALDVFAIDDAVIDEAIAAAKAFLAAEKEGRGATMIGGKMSDRATDRIHRVALQTAFALGRITDDVAKELGLEWSREEALASLERLFADARERVRTKVGATSARLDEEQLAAHALAYLRVEVEAARQLHLWQGRVGGDLELAIADLYTAEVVRSLRGGVDLGQTERIPLAELGLDADALAKTILRPDVAAWADGATLAKHYLDLARMAEERGGGALGLDDETLVASHAEIRRFVDKEVRPVAQDIHRKDVLIPMELIEKMSALGVFGLTIPEAYGGLGLGKVAMCVVTEELSRGYIGVGSLGTRSEIAAELILGGGTQAQKDEWLPKLASGAVMSTAVFTEPNFGSDLAHIQTRADKNGGAWRIYGQKTWITHACRADLMTLLARTDPKEPGYGGLSMFLAPKTRTTGAPGDELVDAGLSGTEIKVLGYRGMKEYELSFDGFEVPEGSLLGGAPGQGFKQLMATFESARIQTAARGVGIAQAALDEALTYAKERVQFGRAIVRFPRVARKIARMVCLTQAARQLTFYAARMKDSGKRCDLEAGMAKLLATRAAWEAADACVQIHGGNGYAEEYTASRLLVDARVLSIFEGANEIQAHVVARRLLDSTPPAPRLASQGGGSVT